jgi:hypothetical protein
METSGRFVGQVCQQEGNGSKRLIGGLVIPINDLNLFANQK